MFLLLRQLFSRPTTDPLMVQHIPHFPRYFPHPIIPDSSPSSSWLKEHDVDWLEAEEEQALQRRAELQELEAELKRREEMLQRREACLQQRSKLETKRLRSSQVCV